MRASVYKYIYIHIHVYIYFYMCIYIHICICNYTYLLAPAPRSTPDICFARLHLYTRVHYVSECLKGWFEGREHGQIGVIWPWFKTVLGSQFGW